MTYFKLIIVIVFIVAVYGFIINDIYTLILAFSWLELMQCITNIFVGYIFAIALYNGAKSVIE